jgi:hypothetical protein
MRRFAKSGPMLITYGVKAPVARRIFAGVLVEVLFVGGRSEVEFRPLINALVRR